MCIAKIMDTDFKAVQPDDRIVVVKRLFDKYDLHHIPVVDNGEIVGIVTEMSLLSAISPFLNSPAETNRDTATLNKRVHQIMTRNFQTIYAGASIYEALELFSTHRLVCIPVKNKDKKLVGTISWHDVIDIFAKLVNKARNKTAA